MSEMDHPGAGRFVGKTHLLPIRVYYEDTDFSGIVYHANYLRFFERGRSDYLRAAGVSHAELLEGESPTVFAVTRIALDFLRPARIDDALLVKTAYDLVRGPRLVIAQAISREGEILARAQVEACCITLTGRPKKPPPLLIERLKPFLTGQASTF
ncbi:MAG: tol-pal system-associated acyl-CoA thioesterase [Hyphomonadaceae bacterium]